jgi:DMSO reductase anchor subunit
MKPALSVIFFTVLSGAGYGLWCLLGVMLAIAPDPLTGMAVLVPLAGGFVLVTAGLLASTSHLGRPGRAWRALSQWRSSWLSREGVAALLAYLPMLALAWLAFSHGTGPATRIAAALLACCACATVLCTANIYRSLKTVAAWRVRRVLPLFFMFALLSGGLCLWAWLSRVPGHPSGAALPMALLALALIAGALKMDYWRAIDALPATTTGHATGLAMPGQVRSFEGPVTEPSYLSREMAFVLARKHASRLRRIAIALFAILPAFGIAVAWFLDAPSILPVTAAAVIAGLFIERWLFFAEARHVVAAFFPRRA